MAVKLPHPGRPPQIPLIEEARRANRIRHRGIPKALDVEVTEDGTEIAIIYSEVNDARPLLDLIRRGPVDPVVAIEIVDELASALKAVHDANYAHLDVHYSNTLIAARSRIDVYLIDLGLSTQIGSAARHPRNRALDPPEIVPGLEHSEDWWALGQLLAQLLAGDLLGYGNGDRGLDKRRQLLAGLPEDLPFVARSLVGVLLEPDARLRLASRRRVREALDLLRAAPRAIGIAANPKPGPAPSDVDTVPLSTPQHKLAAALVVKMPTTQPYNMLCRFRPGGALGEEHLHYDVSRQQMADAWDGGWRVHDGTQEIRIADYRLVLRQAEDGLLAGTETHPEAHTPFHGAVVDERPVAAGSAWTGLKLSDHGERRLIRCHCDGTLRERKLDERWNDWGRGNWHVDGDSLHIDVHHWHLGVTAVASWPGLYLGTELSADGDAHAFAVVRIRPPGL